MLDHRRTGQERPQGGYVTGVAISATKSQVRFFGRPLVHTDEPGRVLDTVVHRNGYASFGIGKQIPPDVSERFGKHLRVTLLHVDDGDLSNHASIIPSDTHNHRVM